MGKYLSTALTRYKSQSYSLFAVNLMANELDVTKKIFHDTKEIECDEHKVRDFRQKAKKEPYIAVQK